MRTFKDGAENDGEGQSIQISGSENQRSNVADLKNSEVGGAESCRSLHTDCGILVLIAAHSLFSCPYVCSC